MLATRIDQNFLVASPYAINLSCQPLTPQARLSKGLHEKLKSAQGKTEAWQSEKNAV